MIILCSICGMEVELKKKLDAPNDNTYTVYCSHEIMEKKKVNGKEENE